MSYQEQDRPRWQRVAIDILEDNPPWQQALIATLDEHAEYRRALQNQQPLPVPIDAECGGCRWWREGECYVEPRTHQRLETDPACRHYEEKR